MKNTHLSHTVLAAAAFLAGLYGSTAWSLLSRSQRVTSTPAVDATSAVNCHGLKHLPEKHLLFAACRDGIEDGRERRFGDLIHVIDPTVSKQASKQLVITLQQLGVLFPQSSVSESDIHSLMNP